MSSDCTDCGTAGSTTGEDWMDQMFEMVSNLLGVGKLL